jgi:hypothetical protein
MKPCYSKVTRLAIPSFSSTGGGVGAGVSSSMRRGPPYDGVLVMPGTVLKERLRAPVVG